MFLMLALLISFQEEKEVVSDRVAAAPKIDGVADDAAWRDAPGLEIAVSRPLPPDKGKSTQVILKSVHTDTHVYFLVRWKDETKDDAAHKPWTWSAEKNAYVEGTEREDMFALAFELSGEFDDDMLSGKEAVWDVWQWKASRTNPQGYAMDRTHRYTRAKPEGKAKSCKDRGGKEIWIARPEDAGDTVEKKQPAPKEKGDASVPQYLPGTPTGSAADVRAKGTWTDGWWTLELERKLDTGHEDDTRFDVGRTYKMAVSAHDRTGDMDKSSGVLRLRFRGSK
ncbi:MAG: hypothetical protein HYY17_13020 [Planctomycetes bacterium]|nr:hypothetical protein [Planctomycetota bacterium]